MAESFRSIEEAMRLPEVKTIAERDSRVKNGRAEKVVESRRREHKMQA
jgi:hypothetical protein